MLHLKHKNLTLTILALISLAYFSAISSLEISSLFRGELILIPLQVFAATIMAFRERGLESSEQGVGEK